MRIIKSSATIFAISLFLMACSTNQTPQTANVAPNSNNNGALTEATTDQNDYWAKDNLDLQRVGNLLERSNTPQEFEGYLNSNNGINNLDLNGDGYVDYISVDEYRDRRDNERGLSLFSRFGPGLVQEIAQIIFYRDNYNSPGSRILLTGNQQIYGDNNYYETNWQDRSIGLVSLLFGNRTQYYSSPYYYNYYPDNYQAYRVVETPYYRSRLEQIYPQPVFVYTTTPTFINEVRIKSPNNGLHLGQIKARLVKPTKDQEEFLKNYPGRPPFVRADKEDNVYRGDNEDKGIKGQKDNNGGKKNNSPGSDNQPRANPKSEKNTAQPSKPAKAEKQNGQSAKPGNAEKQKGQSSNPQKGGNGKGKKP